MIVYVSKLLAMQNELFKIRLNFYENALKKQKSIIFLIPTLLGSVVQFLALLSIDYNFTYLNFFSISQIISDSIFFVFALILTIIFDIIFMFFLGKNLIIAKMKRYKLTEFNILKDEENSSTVLCRLIILYVFKVN